MAYNNNYQGYGGGYQRSYGGGGYQRSYGGGGYQRSYGGGGNYGGRQKKKHSGAKYIDRSKNGDPVITAWNYSRRLGLVNVLVAPYKGTHTVESKNGRRWSVWMAKIQGKGVNEHFPCLVDESKRIAILRPYGWVVNPNAPNGGYCGTFSKN